MRRSRTKLKYWKTKAENRRPRIVPYAFTCALYQVRVDGDHPQTLKSSLSLSIDLSASSFRRSSSKFAPLIMIGIKSNTLGTSIAISRISAVGRNPCSNASGQHRFLPVAPSNNPATSFALVSFDSMAEATSRSTSR